MTLPVALPIPRCCRRHRDWATLAEHLLADFADVSAKSVIDELSRARRGGEMFRLELPDALDCAELIVRQRIISATGHLQCPAPRVAGPPADVGPVRGQQCRGRR